MLQCGIESCKAPFVDVAALDVERLSTGVLDGIRQARARHLIHVFGLKGRFEGSQTGLPERCSNGAPPTSIHVSLHVSVVRAWVEQAPETRRAIIEQAEAREQFVTAVGKKVCELGRGNVYQSGLESDVRAVLPSFFTVLGRAAAGEGQGSGDAAAYEHDFENNGLEAKIRFELAARREER